MDLQALKFFQAVGKLGSISKAARELNYAQSNLTSRIQQLESDLQTKLLYRHNRGTTLTDKGKVLLSYTDEIFQLLDEVRNVMSDDQTPKGPLVIGSMETTAAVRLPALLSRFHREYPAVDLTLKTGPTELNVQRVLQYELDGAFVAGPIEHPDLTYKTVIDEELVLVTDVSHQPLSSIKEIQSRTILVFRNGCSYRARFEEWLHYEGVIPEKIMELGTLDGIIGCVFAGLGISLLPHSAVEKYVKEGHLLQHSIPNQFGKVKTLFIYRKDKYMSASFKEFIKMSSNKAVFSNETILF
ncbi:LysR family transcriptional regulator [Schinkia azotoformans]|uniref:LysR family transcriptional regulator n=1 Tax=Schinkia azotoformans TaxID=1454 RepID=UPI002DBC6965|nr:LysR family transcriptional regulator [Schinkia azotoformans]MEC1722899.1 LysR family transcriptional regulator [Schinkia azotoformans]MED4352840.1 LysR family transcriptional regulator [Schinkia azotoformans]MED4414933.1 LysR family transcriptional regulator [Schinkia azotoformans]